MGRLSCPDASRRRFLVAAGTLYVGLQTPIAMAARSSLHIAVMRGNLKRIDRLIDKGYDVNGRDGAGEYPLHFGIYNGNVEAVRKLLAAGALVDVPDRRSGVSALTIAAYQGDAPMVSLLLEHGANIDFVQATGTDPSEQKGVRAIPAPLRRQIPSPPLLAAIEAGHEDMVEFLLERGANADATDRQGQNALILACRNGRVALAQMLIERGASVNFVSPQGMTPLNMALLARQKPMVRLLVDHGADLELSGPNGITPARNARAWDDPEILSIFQSRGIAFED